MLPARLGVILAAWLAGGCDVALGLEERPTNASPVGLEFDNSASNVDLVGFPVLVKLEPDDLDLASVVDLATDLRFHDPDTDADLPFEIERWDPSREALIWVRVPQIDARSTTDKILLYFGPGVAVAPPSGTAVWSSYDLVFHGSADANAASASYTPTRTSGVSYAEGRIGDAVQLSSPGDRRVTFASSLPLLDQWPTFTIELWIYPDYASPDLMSEPGVLGNGGPINNGRLFSPTTEGPLIMQLDVGFSTETKYPNMYVPQQIWSHVVYTFNGKTMLLYRNGIFAEFDAVGSAMLRDTGGLFELGSRSNALTGFIDELRVSQSYRGPDWVYAQYLSMSGAFARVVPGGAGFE